MTALLARSPLQTLPMSSTQRSARRRSARLAFEDDDAPPVKRPKTENGMMQMKDTGKQTGGKTSRAVGRKKKSAYEEDADGFQFSRTRSKRRAIPSLEPVAESTPALAAPPQKVPTRQKKKTSIPTPNPPGGEEVTKRRRSSRLSGDKAEFPKALSTLEKPKRTKRKETVKLSRDRDDAPRGVGAELIVEKKLETTKIALPFADTPIIKRNKEMRKGSGSRRSSTGSRGRRASSLIDSGMSNAVPHSEVEVKDFYKHIEQSLPEPRRMKQLLTWCGSRALAEKPSGDFPNSNAIMAARAIEEDLVKDFANNSELSDWFSREDPAPAAPLVKQPNPINAEWTAKAQSLEEDIKALREEQRAWQSLTSSKFAAFVPAKSPIHLEVDPSTIISSIDALFLNDPIQSSILSSLSSQLPPAQLPDILVSKTISESTSGPYTNDLVPPVADEEPNPPPLPDLQARIQQITITLEPAVDLFTHGIHTITAYRAIADRAANHMLSSAATGLEKRDRYSKGKNGTADVGTGDLLRALGNVLGRREEVSL